MSIKEIPSAGPWITDKEVEYVADAVRNGWYADWAGYINKFEKAFASWVGSKHSISTSSCTGALTILMRALDIGVGDEVIAPEVTWIATVSAAYHLGAKPVFVDVERDTWCLDPQCVRKAISPKTKAIIAVDMFGHPADKDALLTISRENGIPLIEDAAPGIGSRYKNRFVGTFGLAGVFSFQGAKPLVCGEGGMIVTDDAALYERCYYYWDHCRDKSKILYNTEVGYKFKMTNIQAALGLAQLERIDEIVTKRRQIFFWYRDRLSAIDGLRMNVERSGCYNNFYVPTIVLDKEFSISAPELMRRMSEAGIGNRPFFRCLSKFPMFQAQVTPNADYLAAQGINLPCATVINEQEVDYVCNFVRKQLLG